ncbi:variable surface protein Vir4, putative [Plasmodium vivax]|uniref:Variable surface protein Vir4, putative n=1 Tax=Plasmodium vivax (strain Salvador I) TaxID=126793 RepID=A5KBF9_PLAVS|nr:variable surface protein Vir4, putative [Plasmodium vivax]EDL43209.1 variable surface protein Vir4, putative [Plasmodium vivax]|eukprot:XP_001612936.1 variable surface protein Vir4 [Plasmodium vivax Sal-1]
MFLYYELLLSIHLIVQFFIKNNDSFSVKFFGKPEKELPSEDLYYKFKFDNENLAEYKEDCSSIELSPKNDKVIELCKRVLRYLKTTYAISDHKNSDYDVCMLLNYWTYNRLNEIFGSKDTKSIYRAFAQIQLIWNTYNEIKLKGVTYPKCEPYFEIHSERDWEKRKEFCEYCLDYKTAHTLAGDFKDNYCQKYYEYFEKKAELYKHFEQYCSTSDRKGCPTFYDKCEKYNPKNFLDKLSCHPEMQKKKEDAAALAAKARPTQHAESAAGEPHSGLSTDEGSPDSSSLMGVSPRIAKQAGDVFLGVIVTSMTSGFLYRVSTIYFYYVTVV